MPEKAKTQAPGMVLAGTLVLSAVPLALVELFPDSLKIVMAPASYLLFHNVVEFFSIMVSLSMFGLGWFTYDQSRDRQALFLSTAFLAIGLMDFMHTLANAAMPPLITPNSTNKSTQFWIAVRLFQAAAFLVSAAIYREGAGRWLSKGVLMTTALLIPFLVFSGVTFFPDYLPATFIPGTGQTAFKRGAEYLVIGLLGAAVAAYWRRMGRTGERTLIYYPVAFVICIFSELSLAFYTTAFDTYNLLGHVYKVAAFYLIYQGVYRATVRAPYRSLLEVGEQLQGEIEERRQTEEALREARGQLETRVAERTAELEHSNAQLRREVAERRKAEEALQEVLDRAAWLARFPEENPSPVVRVAADGNVLYRNQASLIRHGWNCRVGQPLRAELLPLFRRAMAEEKEVQQEVLIEGKFFFIWIAPFPREGYANVYGHDITGRHEAERALQASEAKYRFLFEHMREGFAHCRMLFDTQGRPQDFVYLDVNESFGRLTGLEQVVGKKATEIIPGIKEATPEVFEIYGRVASTGQPERFEIDFKPLNRYLSISVYSPAKNYFVAVFDNITERKRTEAALRKRTSELQHLTATLEQRVQERTAELAYLSTQLVSAQENERKRVSYDLHDHVWQMLLAIRFDLDRLFSGEAGRGWTALQSQAKIVMESLLETVGKIRSMQGDLWPYVLDDIGILATLDWYGREFEKNHPGLTLEREDGLTEKEIPPAAKLVIYRITQEALSNVAKYSQADRVVLHLNKKDHHMEFVVEDNGVGFDPVETIAKRASWGGLGLLSIKARTELAGGVFAIESAKGQGTRVRASWPL